MATIEIHNIRKKEKGMSIKTNEIDVGQNQNV